jgi:hypothetical protein
MQIVMPDALLQLATGLPLCLIGYSIKEHTAHANSIKEHTARLDLFLIGSTHFHEKFVRPIVAHLGRGAKT